jgi:Family of unknown function (DUF5677)
MTDEEKEVEAMHQCSESLRQECFLSPWIEKLVPHFHQSNQDCYDYARELNRCGLKIARETGDLVLEGDKSTHAPKAIAYRLLLRSLTNFEAAIILAERGAISEADTLTRGVYEAGFWMGYLQKDGAEAANAILQDSIASELAALRFERKLAVKSHGEKSVEVRNINATITAVTKNGKGKAQNIADLAFSSGYENYYQIYKELSSSVAHTSLQSLHSLMNDNGDGTFDGHIIGPDEDGIESATAKACLALCLNLRSYAELVRGIELFDQLQKLLVQWDEMFAGKALFQR